MYIVVALIATSNTINVGADIGGMAASIEVVAGKDTWHVYPLAISIGSVLALTLLSYTVYASVLKWIGLSIFSYVVFLVQVPWGEVVRNALVPRLQFTHGYLSMLTAALGTTISPYLFVWQSSIEVEELRATPNEVPLLVLLLAVARNKKVMGEFVISRQLAAVGSVAAVLMFASAVLTVGDLAGIC